MTELLQLLKDKIEHNKKTLKSFDNDILKLEKEIMELRIKRCYHAGRFDESNEAYNLINGAEK